jgi:hypothetical protein
VHAPPFGPEKPALQVHADGSELASGELELIGHATHVAATVAATIVEYVAAAQSAHNALPVAILYWPATQAVHGGVPLGPVKPSLQMHCVTLLLALGEVRLGSHVVHATLPVVAL